MAAHVPQRPRLARLKARLIVLRRPHLQKLATWWMLGALVLAALMPTASRLLAAAGQGGGWVEVCTAGGNVRLQLSALTAEVPEDVPPLHVSLDACPYCLPHGGGAMDLMPAGTVPVLRQPRLPQLVGSALLRDVVTSSDPWSPSAPRAPPYGA